MMSFSLIKRALVGGLRGGAFRPASCNTVRAAFSSSVLEETHAAPPPPAPEEAEFETDGALDSSQLPWVKVFKRDVTQSPKKVRFLLKLVRDAWVPDALAQMKFSPKHKSVDVAALIRRGVAVLRARHDLIPEQLMISEVLVTKGKQQKQMTIQGRGRTGFGYRRWSHIFVRVEQIDFHKKIAEAETQTSKEKWQKMAALVETLRETPEYFDRQPPFRERQQWKNRDAYDRPKPPRSR